MDTLDADRAAIAWVEDILAALSPGACTFVNGVWYEKALDGTISMRAAPIAPVVTYCKPRHCRILSSEA